MELQQLREINAHRRARRAVLYVSDLRGGAGRVIAEGDAVEGALGDAVLSAFRSGKSGTVEIGERSFFLNVHLPPARIVVIGAVHISQALAKMAALAGFDVLIIDPRSAFATQERFGGIDLVTDWPQDVLKDRPLDAYTALVAVTHDPKIDDFPLQAALEAGCFYVGALGSRKTHARRVERLTALGLAEERIGRISAPIGLDIGASTPAEIAVAILADIIQALRRRDIVGEKPAGKPAVAAVVLAAGMASRMGTGAGHKLLAEFSGVPLVRHCVETVLASNADRTVVVTGHRAADIEEALAGLDVSFVRNDDYASGMASSLITGLDAIAAEADGMLVVLADMPGISTPDLDRMIAAFPAQEGHAIVRAVADGKRGNPVILPRAAFSAVRRLQGDIGARQIIENSGLAVVDIDIGTAAHLDLDTPDAVLAAGGVLKG